MAVGDTEWIGVDAEWTLGGHRVGVEWTQSGRRVDMQWTQRGC